MSGFSKLVDKRRKPGYDHFFNEMRSGSGRQAPQNVLHDGSVNPRGSGPFKKSKRSRGTRPTPGSSSRIHNPQYN